MELDDDLDDLLALEEDLTAECCSESEKNFVNESMERMLYAVVQLHVCFKPGAVQAGSARRRRSLLCSTKLRLVRTS